MSENGERPGREVKNHILFEIATEVAHRGTLTPQPGQGLPVRPDEN